MGMLMCPFKQKKKKKKNNRTTLISNDKHSMFEINKTYLERFEILTTISKFKHHKQLVIRKQIYKLKHILKEKNILKYQISD